MLDPLHTFAQLIVRPQIPVLHRGGYYTMIERDLLASGVHVVPFKVASDGAGGAPCAHHGWFFKTNPKNPVVIYSHGIHASRGDLTPIALELYRHGINAVVYDSRAHGMSAARGISFGYHERHDVRAIIAHLSEHFAFRSIVLFGMSLGGAISLQAADVDDRITGIVGCSTYYDMAACFRRYFELSFPGGDIPPIDDVLRIAADEAGFDLAATGPSHVLPTLARYPRLLLLHGRRDDLVLPEQAELIASHWGGPVELHIQHEAVHNDVLAYPEAMARFRAFVESC